MLYPFCAFVSVQQHTLCYASKQAALQVSVMSSVTVLVISQYNAHSKVSHSVTFSLSLCLSLSIFSILLIVLDESYFSPAD